MVDTKPAKSLSEIERKNYQKPSSFKNIADAIANLEFSQKIPLVFMVTSISLLILGSLNVKGFYLLLKGISAFLALILIPGTIIGVQIRPKEKDWGWISIGIGLAVSVLEIQILFILRLLLDVYLNPLVFMLVVDAELVAVCFIAFRNRRTDISLKRILIPEKRDLKYFVLLALFIRLVLVVLASESVSPDACLYADYARSVINGSYSSSIAGDTAITNLWNGIDYVIHHGMTYVYAVSFIILPSSVSGTPIFLTIANIGLMLVGYSFVEEQIGTRAASWFAFIVAIHPLFVFHSSVAYGPEITSLFLMMGALVLFHNRNEYGTPAILLAGIMLGLADVIWYINFYIACIGIPLMTIIGKDKNMQETAIYFTVAAALFFFRIFLFHGVYLIIVPILLAMALGMAHFFKETSHIERLFGFSTAGGFIIFLWRWPFFFVENQAPAEEMIESTKLIGAILAPVSLEITGRFIFFTLFHLSVLLTVLLIVLLIREPRNKVILVPTLLGLISAAGTYKVFSTFEKDVLLFIYLYSDSRFFLSIVFLMIIGAAYAFSKKTPIRTLSPAQQEIVGGKKSLNKKKAIIAILLIIGFVPGYLAIPSGLNLVRYEERYGWSDLDEIVSQISSEDTRYLLDRAREFSWFTGRPSATLDLSERDLPLDNVSHELSNLMTENGASYLLVDEYTTTKWKTLEYALRDNMSRGDCIPLDASRAIEGIANDIISKVQSLKMVADTKPNYYGRFSRIFMLQECSYSLSQTIGLHTAGWLATSEGKLENTTSGIRISIGDNENQTTIMREEGYNLGMKINCGFILLEIEETSAEVLSIEIRDSNGSILSNAHSLGDNVYFAPFGDLTIGDIRITIEGEARESVILKSITSWNSLAA
ncbi:MAG: hypothetical protein ACOC38_06770 [Promethearchaeia archaeon]